MRYYEVFVASPTFHGQTTLTYASPEALELGQVVQVSLKNRLVLAIVGNKAVKPRFATKQLQPLNETVVLPVTTLSLLQWLHTYYPSPLGVIVSQFLPRNLSQTAKPTSSEPDAKAVIAKPLPSLTVEQKNVIRTIEATSDSHTFLLHGDTGTGKTRVYIELARQKVAHGRSALVLTPEIGLTSQLVRDFRQAFGDQVVLFHSALGPAKRRQAWRRVLDSQTPLIVIGPRSALFLPFRQLGVVVVDEAHEPAYKQEQLPRFNALRVASQLATLHGARLIYGSATPLVAEYYVAEAKHIPILRMQQLARTTATGNKAIQVVSNREREHFNRDPYLSDVLIATLERTLARKEQSLIYLNRRGTARLVLCQVCGWHAVCPRCDLPLTFHADSFELRCHTCGWHETTPASCPVCGSSDILFKSVGTKSIVASLERLFPQAVIRRFDTDNKTAERLETHFNAIHSGKVDILVGTQMLAKGLDLPRLSLVGVVAADTSLSFPDYTAEERTYQLLSQVIGRVGRGHRPGTVIIQTHNPDNPAIVAAIRHDWPAFYAQQLQERQTYLFPPFCYVLKLSATRKTRAGVVTATKALQQKLADATLKVQVLGPTPSFYERVNGSYQWQLIVKAKQRPELLKVIELLPPNWSYDLDPVNLL